jgi:hypothetical protein
MNPHDLMAELIEGITPRRAPRPKVGPLKHRGSLNAWRELTMAADDNCDLAATTAELDSLDPLRHQRFPDVPTTIFGHRIVEVSDWTLL